MGSIELLNAAYKGELNRFKRFALNHAKDEGGGVAEAIEKLKLKDGRGCLHFAAAGGSLQVCKYLIENLKLGVDTKDGQGCTSLYHASLNGHFDMVRYLLEKGANPNASNDTNLTPLHYAAKSGDTKIITLLPSKGVRLDVVNSSGTALQLLLLLVIEMRLKCCWITPNYDNSEGMLRPLITAVGTESWECMERLL
ncbi:E3 ubiquitin-protein ligase HACE1-like [Papaver somniferum]|uniref:E3 ubiquitin-protein ligase HACE1-like n=1 Tax=Papaver somniferum TaxID=3469 RepID=UPI000E700424|nr:E3 ubiquitin-protein ligase HACE1-like [Papaver somniferum]